MSLTAITQKLLGVTYSFQPTVYWTFEGESFRHIWYKFRWVSEITKLETLEVKRD